MDPSDESALIKPAATAAQRPGIAIGVAAGAALCALAAWLVLAPWHPAANRPKHPSPARVVPHPPVIPPPSDPAVLRPLTPEQAVAWNATTPLSTLPNPPAAPFKNAAGDPLDFTRSLDCLTAAVYYEAASETDDGEKAVAQVVLNRLRHPAFPHTVCGVVFEGHERPTGCQFTFSCDGALSRPVSTEGWARARTVAERALKGEVYKPVGWATHYHTQWVVPYWSSTLVKAQQVGAHIFYRWQGGWGTRRAFTAGYAGVEPDLPFAFGLRAATGVGVAAPAGPPLAVARDERPVLNNRGGRDAGMAQHGAPPIVDPNRDVGTVERPVLTAAGPAAPPSNPR